MILLCTSMIVLLTCACGGLSSHSGFTPGLTGLTGNGRRVDPHLVPTDTNRDVGPPGSSGGEVYNDDKISVFIVGSLYNSP